jgi:hypothetical protein
VEVWDENVVASHSFLGSVSFKYHKAVTWKVGEVHSFELKDENGQTGSNGKIWVSAMFCPLQMPGSGWKNPSKVSKHPKQVDASASASAIKQGYEAGSTGQITGCQFFALLVGIDCASVPLKESTEYWIRVHLAGYDWAKDDIMETTRNIPWIRQSKSKMVFKYKDEETKEMRRKVKLMRKEYGVSDEDVCNLMDIDQSTLDELFLRTPSERSTASTDADSPTAQITWASLLDMFWGAGIDKTILTFELRSSPTDDEELEEVECSWSMRLGVLKDAPLYRVRRTIQMEKDDHATDYTLSFSCSVKFLGEPSNELPPRAFTRVL